MKDTVKLFDFYTELDALSEQSRNSDTELLLQLRELKVEINRTKLTAENLENQITELEVSLNISTLESKQNFKPIHL